MTTFQAIVYAVIEGMSKFLPISSKTHHVLIPYLTGWQPPTSAFIGALTLGTLLSVLVYFRHDWASMISSVLQVIIFRKRPMTIDERIPLFVAVSTIPTAIAFYYFNDFKTDPSTSPLFTAGIFALLGFPLWFVDSMGRKSKGTYDWNWLNAAIVGVTQASAVIPGCDPISGTLFGALFLNYKREPAVKYAYFAITPLLLIRGVSSLKDIGFHNAYPITDLSWLSFGVAILVAFFVGLLAIGGFIKHVQHKGLTQYVFYRLILGAGVFVVYWFRSKS